MKVYLFHTTVWLVRLHACDGEERWCINAVIKYYIVVFFILHNVKVCISLSAEHVEHVEQCFNNVSFYTNIATLTRHSPDLSSEQNFTVATFCVTGYVMKGKHSHLTNAEFRPRKRVQGAQWCQLLELVDS